MFRIAVASMALFLVAAQSFAITTIELRGDVAGYKHDIKSGGSTAYVVANEPSVPIDLKGAFPLSANMTLLTRFADPVIRRKDTSVSEMHLGIDVYADEGAAVHAIGAGIVESRGWNEDFGYYIVLKHPNGYSSIYGHLLRFSDIQVKQSVKIGQVVGYVGGTGYVVRPSLHFALVIDKTDYVDPEALLSP